jgi:diguanylate cyclase (GGDEF)-like protein
MSSMFAGLTLPVRDLLWTALAVLLCAVVTWLDIRTSSDITEAFLVPLAFIAVYPVRRDWATVVTTIAALGAVGLGAWFEDEGEAVEAVLANRGMAVLVILGIAFLMNRVTTSERQLFRIATTDPLTGIFNRRHFMGMLAREQQRAARYGTSFSLLILDIDHFKRINDTFGHPVGDEAIKAMAGAAGKCLRPTDMIGRFGGEEFVVMLPHTDEAGAVVAAERIREQVAKVVVPAGTQDVRFTVSIGAATFARRASVEQLLECADKALYAAKTGGRNQVCVGRLAESGDAAAGDLATA